MKDIEPKSKFRGSSTRIGYGNKIEEVSHWKWLWVKDGAIKHVNWISDNNNNMNTNILHHFMCH